MEALTQKQRRAGLIAVLSAVFAVIVIVIPLFAGMNGNGAAAQLPIPEASSSATPTATPTTDACEAEFTQVAITHEGNKVNDKFYDSYEAATTDATNLSEAQRNFLLAQAASDSKQLAIWSAQQGLYENANDWKSLTTEDGTCLNDKGRDLWYTLKGAMTAKGVTFEEAQAPEDWWNSGMHEGTYGVSPTQGVRGDRTAIKITLADGTVAYILIRCGNPVYPGKPSLPDVPTDNPTPNPKDISEAPQHQDNVPAQQMPNPLPARDDMAQPTEPVNPQPVYTPPAAAPSPNPAPVESGGTTIPAPTQEPTPVVTPPVEAPPGPPPSTCSPAPGRTC